MMEYFWMAGKAFLISLILTPVFRDLFRSYNVVDRPGFRKVHRHPIPRVGGIPIAIAYTFSLLSLTNLTGSIPNHDSLAWKLLPGVILIFVTGLVDDFFNLRPIYKMMGQVLAAAVVFSNGLRIDAIAGMALPAWLSFPITLLWLLLSTNALNLIDGLDGLCAGMGLLATLTLFGGALITGNVGLSHATFPLVGALLGFLCYNFNPATVFLGDSGALLIGFLLGCYGMVWTQKTTTLLSVSVPLLALTIPLMDVSLSIVRRFLNNRPIFSADRGHIHHRLLDRGLSPRSAVLVLYAVAGGAAVLALLLSTPNLSRYHGFVILAFAIAVWLGIQQLRYLEFNIFGRVLFNGEFQRSMARKNTIERLSVALRSACNEDEWWHGVVEAARVAGWRRVCWENHSEHREEELFSHRMEDHDDDAVPSDNAGVSWTFQIPVGDTDRIIFEGILSGSATKIDLLNFAAVVAKSLSVKRQEWEPARL